MDCRTLGENKTNYTNANVRQMRQTDLPEHQRTTGSNYGSRTDYRNSEHDTTGYKVHPSSGTNSRTKRKGVSGGQIVAGALAGASLGVIAGILLAPEKGTELRKQVRNSATRLGGKVTKSYSDTKNKVTSWTNKSNSKSNLQNSPYTDPGKNSNSEVNTMVNDPALGPTGGTNMQRCL